MVSKLEMLEARRILAQDALDQLILAIAKEKAINQPV